MIFALVIAISMISGMIFAEIYYRKFIKPKDNRAKLITEYHDKQLWQFISIDEWLAGNK